MKGWELGLQAVTPSPLRLETPAQGFPDYEVIRTHNGLTKRELFAVLSLQAMIASGVPLVNAPQKACQLADLLLAELAKEGA